MNNERERKLKALKRGDAAKNTVIVTSAEPFAEAIEEKINRLKETLNVGIELKNIDDLLEQLGLLQSFQQEVKTLRESIKDLQLPESIDVKGIDSLVEAVDKLASKKDKVVDFKPIDISPITRSLDTLIEKISDQQVPEKPGQQPSDFVPMRRVMKVGNKLMYDDSFITGSGGGGGTSSSGGGSSSGTTTITGSGGGVATVTGGKLDVNATASLAGTNIPISSATSAVGVAIVDTSGNQIASFGGGTQYVDAGTPPAHPTGTVPVYDNAGTWKSVSTTNKLPVATGITQPTTPSDTQPISAASLPLPSGAATAAKQPALGTAGTASADVITVQGKASMTPLLTDSSATTQPVSGTVAVTGVATSTKQSDGSQKTQVVDGSGNVIGATSNALDINIKSGNPTTITATQGTATNLKTQSETYQGGSAVASGNPLQVTLANTAANATAVKVDGSAVTQPVSGTLTTSFTDTAPVTQNITAVDAVSASSSNQNAQTFYTGTPTAGSAASFALSGQQSIRFLVTGTWSATLQAEYSVDSGTTWHVLLMHQNSIYNLSTGITGNFTANAQTTGMTNIRIRCTAYTSGTAVVKVVESAGEAVISLNNAPPSGNFVSTNNSSVATLTSGSVFTGVSDDAREYSEMRVTVIASHASATDGLSIQQSSDNSNWDITDTYTIPATTGKTFVVPRQARYFRVVYTNGGTNQSSFRLQTILNRISSASSSQRPQDTYSNENDMEQVWALNSLWNGATWDRMPGSTTGVQTRPAPASTATLSNVASSATSVTVLAANSLRRLATFYNDSTQDVRLKFGTTASATDFSVYLPSLGSLSLNGEDYSGRIDGIWISANGSMRVTETVI